MIFTKKSLAEGRHNWNDCIWWRVRLWRVPRFPIAWRRNHLPWKWRHRFGKETYSNVIATEVCDAERRQAHKVLLWTIWLMSRNKDVQSIFIEIGLDANCLKWIEVYGCISLTDWNVPNFLKIKNLNFWPLNGGCFCLEYITRF